MNAQVRLPVLSLVLLAWLPACSPATDEEQGASNPRCAVLCEEDLCGDARSECIDECVVQTDGLDDLCAQCLVQESWLDTYPVLEDGRFCDFGDGWYVCDNNFSCARDDENICRSGLPVSCELEFGGLDECAEYCG